MATMLQTSSAERLACGRVANAQVFRLMGTGEGLPAGLHYRKGLALLGYLAIENGRQHARTAIAALLWPELDERAALTNLRQVLTDLNRFCNQCFGAGVLDVQRTAVGLFPRGRLLFDTDLVTQAPERCLDVLQEDRLFLRGAEDIAGVDFQSWMESVRQQLDTQLLASAEARCDALMAAGEFRAALPLAQMLCKRDPWNEDNARRKMRIHANTGMLAAAITTYRRIEATLSRELGIRTAVATRQLLAEICGDRELA